MASSSIYSYPQTLVSGLKHTRPQILVSSLKYIYSRVLTDSSYNFIGKHIGKVP